MFIADLAGVISSIIYGPDRRTQINPDTRNVLFTVYAPAGIEPQTVRQHLQEIQEIVGIFSPRGTVARLEVYGT